jgi:hypothetical protein
VTAEGRGHNDLLLRRRLPQWAAYGAKRTFNELTMSVKCPDDPNRAHVFVIASIFGDSRASLRSFCVS